jgi:4-hydroxy-tetrahydrodipicolinate reductase
VGSICEYCIDKNICVVFCTTGYTEDELELIKQTSKKIAVFRSANMSLGINVLNSLCKKAAEILKDSFDIEIVEMHHNQKLDAPSGTALLLADSIKTVVEDAEYVYDRHLERKKRSKNEIGIHALRGGTVVGEHSVIFAGPNETVTLSHSALSREVFASGAIKAAAFLKGKSAGLYDMDCLINEVLE